MLIFNREDISRNILIDQKVIEVVESGFNHLAHGDVEMPPIMRIDIPENNGEVDIKSAYIRGLDQFAIKISAGFFNNPSVGLPSGNGMMLLINSETGVPQSVLLDNGYLTDIRTAAAGAIAAKYLAKSNVQKVGVIGSGAQARYQLQALQQVRTFNKVRVYSPTYKRAMKFAEEMTSVLGVEVIACESAEEVVKKSEIVITSTPAKEPVIKKEWLHPGLHITAMGSDGEHKQELEAEILTLADYYVCDVKSQCIRLGELHHAVEKGLISKDDEIVELGEIISGKKKARTSEEQITICDLTGTGVQDTVIALYAYEKLKQLNKGLKI